MDKIPYKIYSWKLFGDLRKDRNIGSWFCCFITRIVCKCISNRFKSIARIDLPIIYTI